MNAESVLLIELVRHQGLDLDLGDVERKCDIFGEFLDLTPQGSLGYFLL